MAGDELSRKLRIALEMADAGLMIKRENLERRHPDASPAEIDRLMSEWLRRRPFDGPGDVLKPAQL